MNTKVKHYVVRGTVSVPVEVIVEWVDDASTDGGDIIDAGAEMIINGEGTMLMEELTLDSSFEVEEVEI